jgi:hypothetical protein
MSYTLERMIDRFARRDVARWTSPDAATSRAVVIRPARDADLPLLHDLAQLDSAPPLRGPALVAVVDGAIWAARGIDDDGAIADPFRPSAEAAGLLALRVEQLRGAGERVASRRTPLRRRRAGRARVSRARAS